MKHNYIIIPREENYFSDKITRLDIFDTVNKEVVISITPESIYESMLKQEIEDYEKAKDVK